MTVCTVDGCGRRAIGRGFCSMHYQRVVKTGDPGPADKLSKAGPGNSHWKGGRIRGGHKRRYWMRYRPDHPAANGLGYVLEHRLIAEALIGRTLTDDEVVHHINNDPSDNRPENLEVMTRSEHSSHHARERRAS